jgi:flavodoxin
MRVLIVYNTRTNFTKRIAYELAEKLDADVEEIIDEKNRQGALGYLRGGKDAAAKKLTKIHQAKKSLRDYDLVILGTPVWVGTMTPAMRTFLKQEEANINKFVCFTTQGGKKRQKVFEEINKATKTESMVNEFFVTKNITKGIHKEKLNEFARRIKSLF